MSERIGILLANLGGPRTPEEIEPFLRDLFSDSDIFPIPGGPLAQRQFAALIASLRTPRARGQYAKLGGGSPLYDITLRQAGALGVELAARGRETVVEVGMRYGAPSQEAATRALLEAGCTRLLLVPLYPHYSIATTGSTINAQRRIMARLGQPTLPWDALPPFPLNQRYIETLAGQLSSALAAWERDELPAKRVVMFSAHGLPQSFVDAGDAYPTQIRKTVERLIEVLEFTGRWGITYQSRVGPVEWLKPYTDESIIRWADEGVEGILAVPISFVADNLETAFEIGIEYRKLARECGIESFVCLPCPNTDPAFIAALAGMIDRRLAKPGPIPGECALPGKRGGSQLVGLAEYETARRREQTFDPLAVQVRGPWREKRRTRQARLA